MEPTKTYSDIAEYGEKYHFYHSAESGTVVCTRAYKGRIIRGTAKCSPEDDFDIEAGKKLAYLRCRQKFMQKKLKRAQAVYFDVARAYAKAKYDFNTAHEFVQDVEIQLSILDNELAQFEQTLN